MPLYRAYGLLIDSDVELPELLAELQRSAVPSPADITIRVDAVPEEGLPGGQRIGRFRCVDARNLWIHYPTIGRLLVSDGRTITIDPVAGADADSVRLVLLGPGLASVIFQRGLLVLHGNAVQVGDACMCCVGDSGAGKSTLSAGFWRRGYPLVADDVVPLDHEGRALPGFPRIKLLPDSAQRLGIDTTRLHRVRRVADKFHVPVDAQSRAPVPLRWVYMLEAHDVPDIRMEPIAGLARFAPLRQHTYHVKFLRGISVSAEHLTLCGQVAGRIRLVKVTRPRDRFCLDELIDALLADMAQHPAGA